MVQRDTSNAGLVGLALSYAMSVTQVWTKGRREGGGKEGKKFLIFFECDIFTIDCLSI